MSVETLRLVDAASNALKAGHAVVVYVRKPVGGIAISMIGMEDPSRDLVGFQGKGDNASDGYTVRGSDIIGIKVSEPDEYD